jgi:hypothetical protein
MQEEEKSDVFFLKNQQILSNILEFVKKKVGLDDI